MNKLKLTLLILLLQTTILAQNPWRFHVAFEDASGAKDTIWLLFDSTATFGVDTALGEGPVMLNYNDFNVYSINTVGDTTKSIALPMFWTDLGAEILALNYTYPLIIRWDTTLFNSNLLDKPIKAGKIENNYFFIVNNHPSYQAFDIFLDDSVITPAFGWGSQSHFPLAFSIYKNTTIGLEELFVEHSIVFPNPSNNLIRIQSKYSVKKITIYNLYSIKTKEVVNEKSSEVEIDITDLTKGVFIIEITDNLNHKFYEKFIKN